MPDMLIAILNFLHFTQLWVTLIGGLKIIMAQSLVASFSSTFFCIQLICMQVDVVLKKFKFKLMLQILLLSQICKIILKGKTSTVLLAVSKHFKAGMHSDAYGLIWLKNQMLSETNCRTTSHSCSMQRKYSLDQGRTSDHHSHDMMM